MRFKQINDKYVQDRYTGKKYTIKELSRLLNLYEETLSEYKKNGVII